MDKVGGRAEIGGKFRVIFDRFKRSRRAEISMLADQLVDRRILSKIFYSGSENNQFGAIGKRHSGSIDGFVSQPRTLRLICVQVHNGLLNFTVKRENVDSET